MYEREPMKPFLTAWLSEAPTVLERELGGALELRPSAQLPQPETATTLAVALGGGYSGRFLVTADRYALQALLAGARMTDGSMDADRDRELWRGILQQIAMPAAEAIERVPARALSVSVEETAWTLGLPSAAYELRFGDIVLLVAFTDEIQPSESMFTENGSENVTENAAKNVVKNPSVDVPKGAPEKPSGNETAYLPGKTSGSAKIAPGGVDLLLDVELEASLRFGSREMSLNQVLDLGAGDVIELDRHASDPVDLLVGDKIVARGEVVLVNGSFGLRVLEVAEPKKCLESIRCLF